jgi:integrative and conjugative element protein (TIGR02256 family)
MIRSFQILNEALKFIHLESKRHFPDETGGILVGCYLEENCVVIQHATGPGPGAHHKPTRFRRDGEYSQNVLDTLVRTSDSELDYIGEWHSHPQASNPSLLDVRSMVWTASNENYAVTEPIMLLSIKTTSGAWEIRCYTLVEKKIRRLEVHDSK